VADVASKQQAEKKRRILIVDNSPAICHTLDTLARRVRTADVEIVTLTNGRRAIARLHEDKFDVIVSDFLMDGADGIEVLTEARAANPAGLRILMTALNEIPVPLSRIEAADVDAYVLKPLELHDVLLLLIAFLHRNESTLSEHRAHARALERLERHATTPHDLAASRGSFAVS